MTEKTKVPFLDLVTPHVQLEEELTAVFQSALRTAGFIGGPMVEQFETEFARFCGTKFCVGVGSGTDAVRFALLAAGVGPAHIVVTVPNTFIATTEAITQAGARPDFVDIDERTYNMDPHRLSEYLETKCDFDTATGQLVHCRSGLVVKAIVPVHLYGQTADMDPILDLARKYNLIVIEDACQAHGAEYYSRREGCWKKAGSMGKAAAFSFYPGKNLGACGEGGAVTSDDEDVARKIRMLRDHGQAQKYYHDLEGYNGRLDAIQAGIVHVKLAHLKDWNEKRRAAAQRYHDMFAKVENVVPPYEPDRAKAIYHLYVVRVADRDALRTHLDAAGVGTGIHYPISLHLQKAYRSLNFTRGDFPAAEKLSAEIVSLPMYPRLLPEAQTLVVAKTAEFLELRKHSMSTAATPVVPETVV
jgi:dTDP-4-amino-4,6-dideoxygalactose transaminase